MANAFALWALPPLLFCCVAIEAASVRCLSDDHRNQYPPDAIATAQRLPGPRVLVGSGAVDTGLPDKVEAIMRSLFAGLSTSLGAAVVLLLGGAPSASQMSFALALAGGVMLTVSVLEMFMPEFSHPERWLEGSLAIFIGFLCFLALKWFAPEPNVSHFHKEDPEDDAGVESGDVSAAARAAKAHQVKQWRLAVILTMALTAHNFPEGLAVAVSSMQSDRLGFVVMAAVAVHNIPEGIAIAMPVLDATGSRLRALQMATLSGLAEPLGALVAVMLLPQGAAQGRGMDFLLCIVGGIMSCVALTELLPEAYAQRRHLSLVLGLIAGVSVMLLTHELA